MEKMKQTVDEMWREAFSVWDKLPKAELRDGQIQEPIPFLGTRKQVTFGRKHPMELDQPEAMIVTLELPDNDEPEVCHVR